MITYNKGAFGLNLIARVHGSAVYKACIPGIVSVGFYSLLLWAYDQAESPDDYVDHPYVIGVLVTSVSFIIIFRANNSYQRVSKFHVAFLFLLLTILIHFLCTFLCIT